MFEILEKYEIPVAPWKIVESEKDLNEFLEAHREIVLKPLTTEHKSELGLVFLRIKSFDEAVEKFKIIKERGYEVIAQKMVKGVEVFVGGKKDSVFGNVISFGLGGVFVEIFKDISMRIWPFDEEEALRMINEIKARKVLDGYRNLPKVDKRRLAELIIKFGKFFEKEGCIEADLNPVICNNAGCFVVDFRCIK